MFLGSNRLSNAQRKLTTKYAIAFLIISTLTVSTVAFLAEYHAGTNFKDSAPAYVGVAFGGSTAAEAKLLIDRVKTYTNLFILDSGSAPLSRNETAINEICDYAVAQGLNVIINLGAYNTSSWFWQPIMSYGTFSNTSETITWKSPPLDTIKKQWSERWGAKFLGVYYNDEPGGVQLDYDWSPWLANNLELIRNSTYPGFQDLYSVYLKMQAANANGTKPLDYNNETAYFLWALRFDPGLSALKATKIRTFTSDYALYWFDYLGGYDVMFAQLGWNSSYVEQIALIKGAARLQNKDWGAIITWKYDASPYLDSGNGIYNQMLAAYEAGAKYITIFDYPVENGSLYGIMRDEHFMALEKFWNDLTTFPKVRTFPDLSGPEAVLILPHNYGWGMRRPDDLIWGFWGPDEKSIPIGTNTANLLIKYGAQLDIVYDDPMFPANTIRGIYAHVYYWNTPV